jgi:hypothetical protein
MVWFNATFNNISVILWRSFLLLENTRVPGENHRPVASHSQTLSHNVVSSTPRHKQGSNSQLKVVIGTDCTGSCKSNYHTITVTTVPHVYMTSTDVLPAAIFFSIQILSKKTHIFQIKNVCSSLFDPYLRRCFNCPHVNGNISLIIYPYLTV